MDRRRVAAAPVLAGVRAAPDHRRAEAQRAHRHGDDREAGRLGRARGHDRRACRWAGTRTRSPGTSGSARRPCRTASSCSPTPAAAPTDEGLSCLFVPRLLPHGMRNVFRIQRLKDKLGNRSNASAEVEFDGTVGFVLGEPGRGVRTIIEMVQRTRLDCVLGTAAGMRQSRRRGGLACARSRGLRRAAGRPARHDLGARRPRARGRGRDADRPAARAAVRSRMPRTAMSRCADSRRRCRSTGCASAARITPTRRSSASAATATPSRFPLARRYREQPVLAIWEGSGNVIALDVLRALTRDPDSAAAFADELATTQGASACSTRTSRARCRCWSDWAASTPPTRSRRLDGSASRWRSRSRHRSCCATRRRVDAEAFIAARLGDERGGQYGVLPARDGCRRHRRAALNPRCAARA